MIVWTIAGSDSGGGAGIQADLKTFQGFNVHGCSVITALTAQNTREVAAVEIVSPEMLNAQIKTLEKDLPPAAIKTGMLGNAEVVRSVAAFLRRVKCPVICDPVMVATSGGTLLEGEASLVLRDLFARVDLLTPNLTEAETLVGRKLDTPGKVETAAVDLLALGCKSVLIKGGHQAGNYCQDFWSDGTESFWLTSPRIESTNVHGTGCTLSSAIAACMAHGLEMKDALVVAKAYINQGISLSRKVGSGHGPVYQGGWPELPRWMPWISASDEAGRERLIFPDTGPEALGFYPIVDRKSWLERILPLGVKTVQLRIKDLSGEALENEIRESISLAKAYDARLFINDYWELAIKHGAYGVHLGQEDLAAVSREDLKRICDASVRLGLSTHCYEEVARAITHRPSYIALGPVYETTLKKMRFSPQGLEALRRWRRILDYPLVAIGGISYDRAQEVLKRGVESIAVVSAVTMAADPEQEVRRWLELFAERPPLPRRNRA